MMIDFLIVSLLSVLVMNQYSLFPLNYTSFATPGEDRPGPGWHARTGWKLPARGMKLPR